MRAGRARRARHTVDRHRAAATAAPPPLAQVGQPLGAAFAAAFATAIGAGSAALALLVRTRFGALLLVPHRKVRRDAAVGAFDPYRDIWTVVLRDVDPRDLDDYLHARGLQR